MFHAAEHVVCECQRRLSAKKARRKPSHLHLREPSLSHSVSSAATSPTSSTHSLSSAKSTSSASSAASFNRHHPGAAEPIEFDPLFMNPTRRAPARLYERPFIVSAGDGSGNNDDDEEDEEPRISREEEDEWHYLMEGRQYHRTSGSKSLDITPMAHTGHDIDGDVQEIIVDNEKENADQTRKPRTAIDYFLLQQRQQEPQQQERPALPRSHWSQSTIMTLDATPTPLPQEAEREREEQPERQQRLERQVRQQATASYPNFSYKRNTVPTKAAPKRPPLVPTADNVDAFIRRGGWKRRGIVFQHDSGYRSDTGSDDGNPGADENVTDIIEKEMFC